MTNIDWSYIQMAVYFILSISRTFTWALGCFVCCALIATAPIGALLCRRWALRQGLDASRYAWLGAFYWAGGFIPWVYFAYQINGQTPPRRLMRATYVALFFAWLVGPVSYPITWLPIANLLALIVALVCWARAEALPATQERVDTYRVIPSVLGSLAMLSGLTWAPYFWSWVLFEVW